MKLTIFARDGLLHAARGLFAPALLLEGSWPDGVRTESRTALDEAIDGRFEWIDREACRLGEALERIGSELSDETPAADLLARPPCVLAPARLNALSLRYYLVKLLRVVAYFSQIRRLGPGDHLELIVVHGRDEGYAELFVQLARAAGADLSIRWQEPDVGDPPAALSNAFWRRWAGVLAGLVEPRAAASRRQIVLCGDARRLDPVCGELLARGCQVWWLCDRFSPRAWLRWRALGVGQLVCNSSLGEENRFLPCVPEQLVCRGINLAPAVHVWIARRLRTEGPQQSRALQQIDAHFRRVLPEVVVLDEDSTPLARAAVALARRHQAVSLVVQRGAPVCRFDFAPLAADRFLAWGRASKRQLIDWDVPPEQVQVTGSPRHDRWVGKLRRRPRRGAGRRRRRILLLATTPPDESRPGAAALHLTRGTYAEMLRVAFASVAKLGDAELMIRPEPTGARNTILRETAAAFASVRCRMAARGPLKSWLAKADCVLTCMSGAGVEAALVGVPTIGLFPASSGRLRAHDPWGLAADVRTEAELDDALASVLAADAPHFFSPRAEVFANLTGSAVARVAQAVLAAAPRRPLGLPRAIVRRTVAEPSIQESAAAASGRTARPIGLSRARQTFAASVPGNEG